MYINGITILPSMATKCFICKEKIETTFLGKIRGTFVKKKPICSVCQSRHKNELEKQF